MTLDAVLNLCLLFLAVGIFGSGYLKILAVSNFGYVLSHIFAISGFLLLRKDRPAWPRPIRLGSIWKPIAVLCIIYDIILLVIGSWAGAITGYDAPGTHTSLYWALAVLVIAVLLYLYRVIVEDKTSVPLRIETPTMPEEAAVTPSV
jgi:amino acid transporter